MDEENDRFVADDVDPSAELDEDQDQPAPRAGWRMWRWLFLVIVAAVLAPLGYYLVAAMGDGGSRTISPPILRNKLPTPIIKAPSTRFPAPSVASVAKPPVPEADNPGPISETVEIGVAYGTEKRHWLEAAVKEFAAAPEGKRIRVNLIPMGSLEAAHAILGGDKSIHVWSPASRLYRDTFVRDWEAKYKGNPIVEEESLALTPMVFVMWKKRYDAFTVKAPDVSFRTIGFAFQAKGGWAAIAGKPEWGRFKFAHTHPNQSNSGLMTLVLLAYECQGKTSGLTVADVMSTEFQERLLHFESGVIAFPNSTGNLMKDMVLRGPTSYDALMVYESVAIDFLETAEGRWDQLQVVYPKVNLWSDNPYCILNTPWATPAHRKAAGAFLKFLLSEPIQAKAMQHGFRPGNPAVAIRGAQSPFVKHEKQGLRIELPAIAEVPSPDVLENLQQSWIRNVVPPGQGGL